MLGMVHWTIDNSHLAMVVTKAKAAFTLSDGFLVEVILHFNIFFDDLHDA
jgi:hypothetical protein